MRMAMLFVSGDCENYLGVAPLKPTFMLKTLEEKLEARTTWLDLKKRAFLFLKIDILRRTQKQSFEISPNTTVREGFLLLVTESG